jgi:hypothetical protein
MNSSQLSASAKHAGAAAPFRVGQPAPSQSAEERFVKRVGELAQAAARHLGMNEAQAAGVGREGLLLLEGLGVGIVPVPDAGQGQASLLLCIDSGLAMSADSPQELSQRLQHASGLLTVYGAALGCSPDGQWMIYRALLLTPSQPRELADAILAAVQLAKFVFGLPQGGGQ